MEPTITLPADQASDILKEITRNLKASRSLVSAGDPAEAYPVPGLRRFLDDDDQPLDFAGAGDLESIVAALIEAHPEFDHLGDVEIRCLWKREGGAAAGRPRFGQAVKASGLVRYWSDCDVIVWLAADYLRLLEYSRLQTEALLYRQLCQIRTDDKGKTVIVGPEFAGFYAELQHYGLWEPRLIEVGRAVKQLRLDGLEG